MILIDTNILARYFLDDIPDHSARCRSLFEQAHKGEIRLYVPATCVSEITWLMINQRKVPKQIIAGLLLELFLIPSIIVENRFAIMEALRTLIEVNGLSFVDCYHLAIAKELGMTQIYSFDKKMDRYPGIERIEPK